jgi:hypothetical protein
MSVDALPRAYRLTARQRAIWSVVVGGWLFLIVVVVWTSDDAGPAGPRLVTTAGCLALFAWLVVALRRSGTEIGPDGIRVRGALRSRHLRWADIADIRVVSFEQDATWSGPPKLVFAWRRDGSRVQLLYFDDRQPVLRSEVELVRDVWAELRGPEWTPSPEALRAADTPRDVLRALAGVVSLLVALALLVALPFAL